MTMRLDLRKLYEDHTGLGRTLISVTPYGCADCGRWYATAGDLVGHVCAERESNG